MKSLKIAVIIVFIVLLPGLVSAIRVNNNTIEVGNNKSDVLSIIGEPVNKQVVSVIRCDDHRIYIEVWTYRIDYYGSDIYYDFEFYGNYLNKIIKLRNYKYGP